MCVSARREGPAGEGWGVWDLRVVGGHAVLVAQEKEEEVFDRNIPAPRLCLNLTP